MTETVRQVDAQARLEVDLPKHQVRIESSQPAALFTTALAEEGYPSA